MPRWITAAAVAAAALAAPNPARAGLVPVQVSVTPEGGYYRFTYAILLPTDSVLRPGDYFTVYDFDGYVPGGEGASGSPHSADWTFATTGTGPTPGGLAPDDDPAKTNLTWRYTGPTIGVNASVGLGNFWALSIYPDTTESWFTASTGTSYGVTDNNITPTRVPVPTGPGPVVPGVPEPATLALAALGLPLAALWKRRGAGADRA
jgi:hypothetical protein